MGGEPIHDRSSPNKLNWILEAQLSSALHVSGVIEKRNKEYVRQRENWKENKARFRERKILEERWMEEQKIKDISGFVEVGRPEMDQESA